MTEFVIGQRLRAIEDGEGFSSAIYKDSIYYVESQNNTCVWVKDERGRWIPFGFWKHRFKPCNSIL